MLGSARVSLYPQISGFQHFISTKKFVIARTRSPARETHALLNLARSLIHQAFASYEFEVWGRQSDAAFGFHFGDQPISALFARRSSPDWIPRGDRGGEVKLCQSSRRGRARDAGDGQSATCAEWEKEGDKPSCSNFA